MSQGKKPGRAYGATATASHSSPWKQRLPGANIPCTPPLLLLLLLLLVSLLPLLSPALATRSLAQPRLLRGASTAGEAQRLARARVAGLGGNGLEAHSEGEGAGRGRGAGESGADGLALAQGGGAQGDLQPEEPGLLELQAQVSRELATEQTRAIGEMQGLVHELLMSEDVDADLEEMVQIITRATTHTHR